MINEAQQSHVFFRPSTPLPFLEPGEPDTLMNESPAKPPMTLSERYLAPLLSAVIWIGLLALFCIGVFDFGESWRAFYCAIGVCVPLNLVIILRRPTAPSRLDLFLIGSGFPFYFVAARIFIAWASKA